MKTITLELTEIEARQIEEFLDYGCRAQGLAVAACALALQQRLVAACRLAARPSREDILARQAMDTGSPTHRLNNMNGAPATSQECESGN